MSSRSFYAMKPEHCLALLLGFSLFLTLAGCGSRDGIETYQVGKRPAEKANEIPEGNSPIPAGHPPIPAGHPPIMSGSPSTGGLPQKASPLTYKKPADWQPGRTGGMRRAAFLITADQGRAEVTVIDLPIQGASGISDVAANVRRWAGQVGLQNLDDRQLEELTHPVEIDGFAGKQTVLLGPETEGSTTGRLGLLAAMIERDGVVWFFKLTGDRSLVASQRETFADFLKSVKFSGSKNGR